MNPALTPSVDVAFHRWFHASVATTSANLDSEAPAGQPEPPAPYVGAEPPTQLSKLVMLIMSGQAFLAAAMSSLAIVVLLALVIDPASAYDLSFVEPASEGIARFVGFVRWPTALAFIVWFYYALRTNARRGRKKNYGPGWAVGSFLIPIASLILPYLVMRELCDYAPKTPDSERRNLVALWWGSFVAMHVGNAFSSVLPEQYPAESVAGLMTYNGIILVRNAIWLAAAVTAVLVVKEVTRRQQTWKRDAEKVAEVFA
ncbi:MAG: DUF4328 domain-containing protein [Myxococcota bacterium]